MFSAPRGRVIMHAPLPRGRPLASSPGFGGAVRWNQAHFAAVILGATAPSWPGTRPRLLITQHTGRGRASTMRRVLLRLHLQAPGRGRSSSTIVVLFVATMSVLQMPYQAGRQSNGSRSRTASIQIWRGQWSRSARAVSKANHGYLLAWKEKGLCCLACSLSLFLANEQKIEMIF